MTEQPISHKELIRRAALWLQNNQGCSVVICDRKTRVTETPDALGFKNGSTSILIECKAFRNDFLADKKKYFRKNEDYGVGDFRYFMTYPNVIVPGDEIEGWGVIECHPHQCKIVRQAVLKVADKRNEIAMLTSMIRRIELAGAVFVRHEPEAEVAVTTFKTHPGKLVYDECHARQWSLIALQQATGIERSILSSLVSEKHDITPEISAALGRAFGVSSDFFYRLQRVYDGEEVGL